MSEILNTSGEFYFAVNGEYSLTTYNVMVSAEKDEKDKRGKGYKDT